MVEFRWIGRELQYRERSFEVDASGAFCGLTDFGDWRTVSSPFLQTQVESEARKASHTTDPKGSRVNYRPTTTEAGDDGQGK